MAYLDNQQGPPTASQCQSNQQSCHTHWTSTKPQNLADMLFKVNASVQQTDAEKTEQRNRV